jgi:hypothetical protein
MAIRSHSGAAQRPVMLMARSPKRELTNNPAARAGPRLPPLAMTEA